MINYNYGVSLNVSRLKSAEGMYSNDIPIKISWFSSKGDTFVNAAYEMYILSKPQYAFINVFYLLRDISLVLSACR